MGKSAAGKISGGNSCWEEFFQGRNSSLKTVLVQYWKLELFKKTRNKKKLFKSTKVQKVPKSTICIKSTKSTRISTKSKKQVQNKDKKIQNKYKT